MFGLPVAAGLWRASFESPARPSFASPARFAATKPWRSRAQPLYKLTSEFGLDGEVDFLSPYYGLFRSEVSNFFFTNLETSIIAIP